MLALLVLYAGTATEKDKQSVDFVYKAMVGGKPETKQGSWVWEQCMFVSDE